MRERTKKLLIKYENSCRNILEKINDSERKDIVKSATLDICEKFCSTIGELEKESEEKILDREINHVDFAIESDDENLGIILISRYYTLVNLSLNLDFQKLFERFPRVSPLNAIDRCYKILISSNNSKDTDKIVSDIQKTHQLFYFTDKT